MLFGIVFAMLMKAICGNMLDDWWLSLYGLLCYRSCLNVNYEIFKNTFDYMVFALYSLHNVRDFSIFGVQYHLVYMGF